MSPKSDDEEMEAFFYAVTHDLRAPLRAIDGFAKMLEEDESERLSEEGRQLIGIIRDNAVHMAELIDELVTFARLSSAEVECLTVDMAELARGAFLETIPSDGRQRIDFDLAPLPPANGDPRLLRQVWANLISNAVKFSSKRDRVRVELRGERIGQELVYSVRDEGVGFDMRYYEKRFGIFPRLHPAREFEGSGMGLAIVRKAVAKQGGRVWAEGETGRGAVFYFALPAPSD